MGDVFAGGSIPVFEVGGNSPQADTSEEVGWAAASCVLGAAGPDIPGGAVAVADVGRAGWGAQAFDGSGTCGDKKVDGVASVCLEK